MVGFRGGDDSSPRKEDGLLGRRGVGVFYRRRLSSGGKGTTRSIPTQFGSGGQKGRQLVKIRANNWEEKRRKGGL